MTNHKSKAQECIKRGDTCQCIKGDEPCEEHQIEAIVFALREAELSGARKMQQACAKKADESHQHPAKKDLSVWKKCGAGHVVSEVIRGLSPESVVEG